MTQDSEGNRDESLLERHWPLALGTLALLVLCLVYVFIYTSKPHSSGVALLLAVLPELVASLAIAVCLYVLLRRDFRAIHANTPRPAAMPPALERELATINVNLAALSERAEPIRRRASLPTLDVFFRDAQTISIIAVSGLGLINQHRGLLEQQMSRGVNIRVLLLDLDRKDALAAWDSFSNPPMIHPEEDIKSGVRHFLALGSVAGLPGTCEVKLLDTLFHYSMVISENSGKGVIQVEMHAYQRAPEERANFLISSDVSPDWYVFFKQQFELAWNNSRVGR